MAYTSNIPLSSLTPEERQFADRISEMAETADRRRIKADASRVSGRGTVPDGR